MVAIVHCARANRIVVSEVNAERYDFNSKVEGRGKGKEKEKWESQALAETEKNRSGRYPGSHRSGRGPGSRHLWFQL